MSKKGTLILNQWDIDQKTRRIAYQILEDNYDEKEIYLIGIKNQGYRFAEQLMECIRSISKIKIHLHSIKLNKRNPLADEIEISLPTEKLTNAVVILADDVASTGRTMFYAIQVLNDCLPKKVQVTVLVDRKHKKFPICSDFVGLSLSTTVQENIIAELKEKNQAVYMY